MREKFDDQNMPSKASDIDLFIYGITDQQQANEKVKCRVRERERETNEGERGEREGERRER